MRSSPPGTSSGRRIRKRTWGRSRLEHRSSVVLYHKSYLYRLVHSERAAKGSVAASSPNGTPVGIFRTVRETPTAPESPNHVLSLTYPVVRHVFTQVHIRLRQKKVGASATVIILIRRIYYVDHISNFRERGDTMPEM